MALIVVRWRDIDNTRSVSTGRLNIGSPGTGKSGCEMGLAKSSTMSNEASRYS